MQIELKLRPINLQQSMNRNKENIPKSKAPHFDSPSTSSTQNSINTQHTGSSGRQTMTQLPKKEEIVQNIKELMNRSDWVPNGNNPCEMYKIVIGDRVAAKGVVTLDYSVDQVVKFFQIPDAPALINEEIIKYQTLQQEPDSPTNVVYMQIKTVWPVSNRDFVITTTKKQEGDTWYMVCASCDYKKKQYKNRVRGQIYPGGYVIEKVNQKSCRVTYISDTDPKGSIPNVVKNNLSSILAQKAAQIAPAMKKAGF